MLELPINDPMLYPAQESALSIELGTVGWYGEEDHSDLGTDENDGTSLVKVTLYRGQQAYDHMEPGAARGHRVLARVMGPAFYVPPIGTEVVVAFPGGFGLTPGAAIIMGTLGRTPSIQFGKQKAKLDVGPDQDLVLKGRSVTLCMYNQDDPTTVEDFLSISPDGGIQAVDRNGFGFAVKDESVVIFAPDPADGDAKVIIRLTKDSLTLAAKSSPLPAALTLQDGEVKATGSQFTAFTPTVAMGMLAAMPATAALIMVGGVPTPSATVAISP